VFINYPKIITKKANTKIKKNNFPLPEFELERDFLDLDDPSVYDLEIRYPPPVLDDVVIFVFPFEREDIVRRVPSPYLVDSDTVLPAGERVIVFLLLSAVFREVLLYVVISVIIHLFKN